MSPLAPLKAAMLTERHEGLLRHSKVHSKMSYTVNVPTRDIFKQWNSSFRNECCRKLCEIEYVSLGWGKMFDSVQEKYNMRLQDYMSRLSNLSTLLFTFLNWQNASRLIGRLFDLIAHGIINSKIQNNAGNEQQTSLKDDELVMSEM